MKNIIVYQENSEPVTLFDNDKSNIINYSEKISKMLESSKVSIIDTDGGVLIVKPSKITSIKVTEDKNLNSRKIKIKVSNKAELNKKRENVI